MCGRENQYIGARDTVKPQGVEGEKKNKKRHKKSKKRLDKAIEMWYYIKAVPKRGRQARQTPSHGL